MLKSKSIRRSKCKHTVYQLHHPDRDRYPDYTIRLRRNHHLFIWRQVQSLRNDNNSLIDLINLKKSIDYEIKKRVKALLTHASV